MNTYDSQLQVRKRAIVFGDFNIDLLSKNKTLKRYKQRLHESGHKILNKVNQTYCTRDSTTKKSILDHVSTNLNNEEYNFAIINSSFSDHKQIYLQLNKWKPPKLRLNYETIDYNKLYITIESRGLENAANSYEELETTLIQCIKRNTISRNKIVNPPREEWVNNEIIIGINLRNYLWVQHKKDQENERLLIEFKIIRDEIARLIQFTKNAYFYNLFMKYTNTPKKMWTLINNLANNKMYQNSAPSKLIVNSDIVTGTKEICELFNKYFSTIGSVLAEKIPRKFHDCSKIVEFNKQYDVTSHSLTTLQPCNAEEIIKIIKDLDANSSSGIDKISIKIIKNLQNLISNVLAKCFNKHMTDGEFPDSLKVAKVTPIYKSGPKTDPGNYRPISVLPVMSKILEKLIHSRLLNYFDSINFISDRQYGFIPKHNTTVATIDLVTKIRDNIDKKNIVLGVFIDLKKAFDTVSHTLLLNKLEHISGIQGNALKMLKSYLTNRHQIVKINDVESSALPVTYGVPQGSILGPLLFLIYINQIAALNLHGHITLYADDTCLFYFGKNIHNIISQAQEDLDILFEWFQYNLLSINISKTCFIIFKAKNKKISDHRPLTIDNIPLEQKQCEKYLGLKIDNNLNWNNQIDYIKDKLSSLTGSLYNISNCIPKNIRFTIYNSLVKSHLLYLIEIWGNAGKTKLQELQRVQNKIIKILFRYPYLTPTYKIFEETKLMNIKQLYMYTTCILIRKILDKKIKTNLSFTKISEVSKRSRRRPSLLVLPKPRTNYSKRNITYEGANIYNNLPSNIKNVSSFNIFKSQLSKYITENFSNPKLH